MGSGFSLCIEQQPELEYLNSCIEAALEMETRERPNPAYMTQQTRLTPEMRKVLVDWFLRLDLDRHVVFTATNILDRFLSYRSVWPMKLQVVGAACLLLASKMETDKCLKVSDFECESCARTELAGMERIVAQTLNYNLGRPTSLLFLDLFGARDGATHEHLKRARRILTQSLRDIKSLTFLPSHLALGALQVAAR